MNSLAELMNKLNIEHYPDYWNRIYSGAMQEYEKCGSFFVDEGYILDLNKKFRLFTHRLDIVLEAAAKTRKKPELLKFIWLLRYAMLDRVTFRSSLSEIILPAAPEGEDVIPYDFASLFALLPAIPDSAESMRAHGVPEDIIFATLQNYETCIDVFEGRFGRPGYDTRYLTWSQLFVDAKILSIGRLQFEMQDAFPGNIKVFKNNQGDIRIFMNDIKMHHSGMIFGSAGCEDEDGAYNADFCETDEYYEGYPVGDDGLAIKKRERLSKSEWNLVLSNGAPFINIHIPETGGKLSSELCEEAYTRAREIFAQCYPEFKFKVFMCFSWLMDPQLKQLLNPNSGIVQFQSKFMRFPIKTYGKAVFVFVFRKAVEHIEDLPENTSLERAIKKHYLNGKYIYEHGGVFLA